MGIFKVAAFSERVAMTTVVGREAEKGERQGYIREKMKLEGRKTRISAFNKETGWTQPSAARKRQQLPVSLSSPESEGGY